MIIFKFGEICNHPKYIVSDEGVVYRKDNSGYHELKPDYSNGYARVDLDGTKEYVGRLVLETFGSTRNLSQRLFYIDGDKTNNSIDNLVWLTPSEIALYSTYTLEYRLRMFDRGAR